MANLHLIAKGGLIILILITVIILIERYESHRLWVDIGVKSDMMINDSIPTMIPTVDIEEPIFLQKFSSCLKEHSKSHYYLFNQISSVCTPHETCIHNFLIDFSKLMGKFQIKLLLLEPTLLFCLLPSSRKYNLLTRGFIPSELQRSRNVITFGLERSDAELLDEARIRRKLISAKFRILKFRRGIGFDQANKNNSSTGNEADHYLISKQDLVIHLIVLNTRETYLWSSGLNTTEINLKGLQYVNDTAFENFNTSLVHLDSLSTTQMFLPFDTRCFLLDMMSSKFIECNASSYIIPNGHSKIEVILKELKNILNLQMVTFWMWSKTLQGWFEKCDILHYSEELKFSVAAKSVFGLNFTILFANSECEHIETNFNLDTNIKNVKLNCRGILIDLIFMYEDKISYWYEYTDEQSTYRLKFPRFTLCSTDVFGEKIRIPCETSEIFEEEYGHFLKNETLILNSENMKNVLLIDKI